jgi:ABC transporter, cydDC cysteine exporter family, permease/ATP-binding protein cydC
MSGGERRRLLFARALASPADYLLLDEPAEHLDSDTADALVADLLAAGKAPRERERTVVLVTHRLTPLWQADRVILLSEEDGRVRVAAAGKHEELANLIPDYRWSLRQEL